MHANSRFGPRTPDTASVSAGANSTDSTPGAGQVRLADHVVAAAALKQHPDRYISLFSRARSEVGHAICLCRTDQVVRLVPIDRTTGRHAGMVNALG